MNVKSYEFIAAIVINWRMCGTWFALRRAGSNADLLVDPLLRADGRVPMTDMEVHANR